MNEFEFSIRSSLKRAWNLFAAHVWYFLVLAAIMGVLNFFSNTHHNIVLKAVAGIAGIVWSYVALSSALAAVDGKNELLRFDALKLHLPTFVQFFKLIGIAIASVVIIAAGFIMLIIPGIYFMVRLMFSNFALIDRKGSVTQSMRHSWKMVKGDVFWTALLAFFVALVCILIGVFAAFVGLLIAYPIVLLFLAILYRDLTNYQPQAAVVEQPKEIPPTPTSSPETMQ